MHKFNLASLLYFCREKALDFLSKAFVSSLEMYIEPGILCCVHFRFLHRLACAFTWHFPHVKMWMPVFRDGSAGATWGGPHDSESQRRQKYVLVPTIISQYNQT